ncbi:histidine phosphatase family protein [Rubrobacter indicoceani]|uniref:histidine phosphatase family protein n=1 Tax=Rubrobacter indicoceani TaxID=2051957 RepID=UPI000E5AAF97|nr:histidine phosphatase family protein [Rubrobacter indicoceani]
MRRLYLVRHAPANWPEARPCYRGSSDVPLSEAGRAEARQLARRLGKDVGRIYTSDLARARQTARAAADRTGAGVSVVRGLGEMDFGAWEGRSHAELLADGCPVYRRWLDKPFEVAPPGGEGFGEFCRRVRAAFRSVMEAEPEREGTVVLVGHGGSLRVILTDLLGMPKEMHFRLRVDHSSLSIVEWSGPVPVLCGLNDVSHLARRASP